MPLQKLPTSGLDDPNHRRRAREVLNKVLDHSFDDSRRRTDEEISAGVTPVNKAFEPGNVLRYGADRTGTTDSSYAIDSAVAVASASSYRGQVYAPRGQYQFDGIAAATQGIEIVGDGRRETVLAYNGTGHAIDVTAGNVILSDLQVHGNASALSMVRWTDAANGVMERVHISPNGATADCMILQGESYYHRIVDCMIDGSGTPARGMLISVASGANGPNSSSVINLRVQNCTTAIDITDGNDISFYSPRLEAGITTGFDIRANTRDITIIAPRLDWNVASSKGFNIRAGAARVLIINPRNDVAGAGAVLLSDAGTDTLMLQGRQITGKPIFLGAAFISDSLSDNPFLDFGTSGGTQRGLIQIVGTIFDFFARTGNSFRFRVNGGTTSLQLDVNGNAIAGLGSLATTATDGFLYVPSGAGPPTGVPTANAGYCPVYVDTTNSRWYFFSNGAWRNAGP